MSPNLTSHWESDHYQAFALLYAAQINGDLHPSETAYLAQHFTAKVLEDVQRVHAEVSDLDKIRVMQAGMRAHFDLPDARREFWDRISDMFQADGRVDAAEHAVEMMMKHLLN